ncbi:MAG: hypothetical protein NWE95_11635 [Candidatus Bathyarchaeota archaeon]|nr:hypothetical protein [Candidatus Bathyarchaeota archaeon]
MATQEANIRIRIDVDYPYASRPKSFLAVALRRKSKTSPAYLQNARVIATMINDSPKKVHAYWFFTPYTIPDKRLLDLLNPERHEVALHVATRPYEEWKTLEKETNRTIKYYTIHGTKHLIMRILWGRKLDESQAKIPPDFPLISFHDAEKVGKTFGVDAILSNHDVEESKRIAEEWIKKNFILSIHPEWLFQKKGRRPPYYEVLRSVLAVDEELKNIHIHKRFFARVARNIQEYLYDLNVTPALIEKLRGRGVDILTFLDRRWCCPISNPSADWIREEDNVALLEITDYEKWWSDTGKKTRNMVRKAEKSGVSVSVVEPSEELAVGIYKIYNETPIRQERAFPHYGESLETVRVNMYAAQNNTFITAVLDGEILGFIQLLYGDHIAIVSNILSLQKHWDKALNNALLAKAVEVCASKGERWLMYGRIGNHPSLDKFKNNHGFVKFPINRYYIPLTSKGRTAVRLGLHRELKDALPSSIKYPLFPIVNWVSRTKVWLKLRLKKLK